METQRMNTKSDELQTIVMVCMKCGKEYRDQPQFVGRKLTCGNCNRVFVGQLQSMQPTPAPANEKAAPEPENPPQSPAVDLPFIVTEQPDKTTMNTQQMLSMISVRRVVMVTMSTLWLGGMVLWGVWVFLQRSTSKIHQAWPGHYEHWTTEARIMEWVWAFCPLAIVWTGFWFAVIVVTHLVLKKD